MRALEQERRSVRQERAAVADTERQLRLREQSVRDREEAFTKRLNARLDDEVRSARREIDTVIEGLKARSAELSEQAARQLTEAPRLVRPLSTGETGAVRADARKALEEAVARVKAGEAGPRSAAAVTAPIPLEPGMRVTVGALGIEGTIVEVHGKHAEVDVRGKRLRAVLRDLRAVGGSASPEFSAPRDPPYKSRGPGSSEQSEARRAGPGDTALRPGSAERSDGMRGGPGRVHVNVELQPREGLLSELNVIGCTVDEALERTEKFLDAATVTDQRSLRIIHGHGTGQLRRAIGEYLRNHPLVAHYAAAPRDQGGAGATVVELKD
jgi:DNA mismatch repair protein MutS2